MAHQTRVFLILNFCLLMIFYGFLVKSFHTQKWSRRLMEFQAKRTKPTPGSVINTHKGFGFQPKNKVDTKQTVRGKVDLESTIQDAIDRQPGLREAMNLQKKVTNWNATYSRMTATERSAMDSRTLTAALDNEDRLQQLRTEGWTDRNVHNKLHELTWDSSAQLRDERHKTTEISSEVEAHMRALVQWVLHAPSNVVCDVGTGTGVLIKYLHKYAEEVRRLRLATLDAEGGGGGMIGSTMKDSSFEVRHQEQAATEGVFFSEAQVTGVDLSSEMLRVAQGNFPSATFHHCDFLDYLPHARPSPGPTPGPFTTVVFNECLHNFIDIKEALAHATSLITTRAENEGEKEGEKEAGVVSRVGRIVISHPRGYTNVLTQSTQNSLLVPSLLPSAAELHTLAGALGLRVALAPSIRAAHYLAVLEYTPSTSPPSATQ